MIQKFNRINITNLSLVLILLSITMSCKSASNHSPLNIDTTHFKQIFDGRTFNGWDADKNVWRIENGCFVGEVTATKQIKTNSFLIWKEAKPSDFEFYAEYKISNGGNSGINYRSEEVNGIPFAVKGYQADIDGANIYTGQNYEERGRGFLAMRGQKTILEKEKQPLTLATIGASLELKKHIKENDWNTIYLVVKGNHMKHYINGYLMSETIDNDTINQKFAGLLCLQLHVSTEMKVEFRNLKINTK